MEIKFSYTLSKSGDELSYARKGECPLGIRHVYQHNLPCALIRLSHPSLLQNTAKFSLLKSRMIVTTDSIKQCPNQFDIICMHYLVELIK